MSDDFKPAEPSAEHRWLQQLCGNWTFEGECITPDGSNEQKGTQTISKFGDLWIRAEGETEVDGGAMKSFITLGYDPDKSKFVGSFIATVMTSFWVYEGELDAGKKLLPLKCKGPRFDGKPGLSDYEDVIEIVSADEYWLRGRIQQDDGTWFEFMKTRYTRA